MRFLGLKVSLLVVALLSIFSGGAFADGWYRIKYQGQSRVVWGRWDNGAVVWCPTEQPPGPPPAVRKVPRYQADGVKADELAKDGGSLRASDPETLVEAEKQLRAAEAEKQRPKCPGPDCPEPNIKIPNPLRKVEKEGEDLLMAAMASGLGIVGVVSAFFVGLMTVKPKQRE